MCTTGLYTAAHTAAHTSAHTSAHTAAHTAAHTYSCTYMPAQESPSVSVELRVLVFVFDMSDS